MHRTLAINRIPSGGICITVKLSFKSDFAHRILSGMADKPPCRLPGGPAGCPPGYSDIGYLTFFYLYLKFRGPKLFAIAAKTNLPWKTTSGGRCHDTFARNFLARSNNRDLFFLTEDSEISGQITVAQKVEHQIA
jgi:hypothetical protein